MKTSALVSTILAKPTPNLFRWSEDFTNAVWLLTPYVTIAGNAATDPLGGLTADSITGVGASANLKAVRQIFTSTPGPLTASFYLKAGTHSLAQILWDTDGAPYANFDLNTGILGAASGVSTITAAGDGWYRCTHTFTPAATLGVYVSLVDSTSAFRAQGSTSTGTLYVWGAQAQRGSRASRYQATA